MPHRRRRSSAPDGAADEYRSLAADYHWFLDDTRLRVGCDTPGVRLALRGLRPGARVLDAACGIGVDAIALARRGFVVVGADGSAEMVQVARRRADEAAHHTPLEFRHSAWLELTDLLPAASFDAALCVGSSLAHTSSAGEMTRVLATLRTLLADSGLLIVDTRDWEATASGEVKSEVEPIIVERNGERCRRRYRWHQPSAEGPVHLEATLEFLDERGAVTRSVTNHVRQRAFTRRGLRAALVAAGFRSIALDHVPGDDRYTATARR